MTIKLPLYTHEDLIALAKMLGWFRKNQVKNLEVDSETIGRLFGRVYGILHAETRVLNKDVTKIL